METKIPTTLWRTQLMQLLSEAPRAVCIESVLDWTHETAAEQANCTSTSTGSSSSNTSLTTNTDSSLSKYSTTSNGNGINMERTVEFTNHNGIKSTTTTTTFSTSSLLARRKVLDSTPTAEDIEDLLIELKNSPFGRAFHGYLHHSRLQDILLQDGHYLVRKRSVKDPDYILSLRFNGHVKNYIVDYDYLNEVFGVNGKSYATLQELVQEGLITLYLDLRAKSYIELMVDLNDFHIRNNGVGNNAGSRCVNGRDGRGLRSNSASPSPTTTTASSTLSRSSIERHDELRSHVFSMHTFLTLPTCAQCLGFMWGISSQGLLCTDCGLSTHVHCSDRITTNCTPALESIKEIFGSELRLLIKAAGGGGTRPPFVLEKCIEEIEKRGLHTEGIYRVSGSRELIDKLKILLETERTEADLSTYADIHSMCGLVKRFLRLLPKPLITSQVFQEFLTADNGSLLTIEMLRRSIRKLPPSHRLTLKYILIHLHRVSQNSTKNRMTAFNLSSVFTPSIICPNEISLNNLKIGTTLLEALITHVPILYFETNAASAITGH